MAKFVIKTVNTGTKFDFVCDEGKTVGRSEVYAFSSSCKQGIESVKANCKIAKVEDQTVENFETLINPKFELYADKDGKFRFRLKARNGEEIFGSSAYDTKELCETVLKYFAENAAQAEIETEAAK